MSARIRDGGSLPKNDKIRLPYGETINVDFAKLTFAQDQEAIVVVFDIRSSPILVTDLTLRNQLDRYVWLVGKIKERLAKLQMQHNPPRFGFYKFTGDGWILLFPINKEQATPRDYALDVMQSLSEWFEPVFRGWANEHLDTQPPITGLTFGVDKGPLRRTTIFQEKEYLAYAIIVACRLQAAVGEIDQSSGCKALVRKSVFNELFSPAKGYVVEDVRRKFRNIEQDREIDCKKISLPNAGSSVDRAAPSRSP
jgi:hypothetical protein